MSRRQQEDDRVPVEVVATRGDGIFLIKMRDGLGAIVHIDREPPQIWPSQSIGSIVKFGFWQPFEGDPQPALRAARQAIAGDEHAIAPLRVVHERIRSRSSDQARR